MYCVPSYPDLNAPAKTNIGQLFEDDTKLEEKYRE
jgi:hypothetical protein